MPLHFEQKNVITIVAPLLEISSQMECLLFRGIQIGFLFYFSFTFSSSCGTHVPELASSRIPWALCKGYEGRTGPPPVRLLPEPPLRIEALKELKVCLERQKTDESHFQLVLSPLTLAEEHSMGQRVSHTLCLSGDCTHCPSKIKLISTCRKG